jgi:hypothetical protein
MNTTTTTTTKDTTMTTTAKLNLNLMSLHADSRSSVRDLAAMVVDAARALGPSYDLCPAIAHRLRPFLTGEFATVAVRVVHAMPADARDVFVAATDRGVSKVSWRGAFDAIKAAATAEAKARREARNAERKAARSPEKVAEEARFTAKIAGDRSSSATAKVAELQAKLSDAIQAEAQALNKHATKVAEADAAQAIVDAEATRHADEAKADAANACGTCGGELCTHSGYTHDDADRDAEGFTRRACAPCGLGGFSRASLSRGPCSCADHVDPAPHAIDQVELDNAEPCPVQAAYIDKLAEAADRKARD